MNKNKKIIIVLVSIIILVTIIFLNEKFFKIDVLNFNQKLEQEKNLIENNTKEIYTNERYNFTFTYPSDYSISEINEEARGGETIFVEGKERENSFQIFIVPFDESGPITPERIKKDLPKAVIEEPQNILIANKTIPALMFFGKSELITRTREIWFVKNDSLYQVTAYDNMDNVIGPILDSLRFQ